jgi:hypothetical protein
VAAVAVLTWHRLEARILQAFPMLLQKPRRYLLNKLADLSKKLLDDKCFYDIIIDVM